MSLMILNCIITDKDRYVNPFFFYLISTQPKTRVTRPASPCRCRAGPPARCYTQRHGMWAPRCRAGWVRQGGLGTTAGAGPRSVVLERNTTMVATVRAVTPGSEA